MKVYRCDTCGEVFPRDEIFMEQIQIKSLDGKRMHRSVNGGKHICTKCSDKKYGPPVKKRRKKAAV